MTCWLDVFTPKSWEEFNKAGARVSGFPERRWGRWDKSPAPRAKELSGRVVMRRPRQENLTGAT
ncbi:MAG: hypothetical protein ISS52_02460 [Dehalococcoidia bacterium]|nr:hypothetical protein [Dehalococcoidia bacterium]